MPVKKPVRVTNVFSVTFLSKGLWKKSSWKLFSLTNKISLIFKLLMILCHVLCTLSLGPGSQVEMI